MPDAQSSSLPPKVFSIGRPSIPPEQLLRALLLQSLYTVRSERLLKEEIDYSVDATSSRRVTSFMVDTNGPTSKMDQTSTKPMRAEQR